MCSLVEKKLSLSLNLRRNQTSVDLKLTPKQHNLNSWVDYPFETDYSSSSKSNNLYVTNATKL